MEQYESSPTMKNVRTRQSTGEVVPFNTLEVYKSFVIPVDIIKEASLRTATSIAGKKYGKVFRVKKHKEFTDENGIHPAVFEIGRLPDVVKEGQLPAWDSSPIMKGEK